MKKLISFALWGTNPKYTQGALKNAYAAPAHYPGWVCRYYCASDADPNVVNQLKALEHVEVIDVGTPGDWKFSINRFLPISEDDIERVICRDCDSRFSDRETEAVKQWIDSGKIFHVMRDHPWHGNYPVLAGMFGMLGNWNLDISTLFNLMDNQVYYGCEQAFMAQYVWPLVEHDAVVHDEIFHNYPFPTSRTGLEYVGEPFGPDDQPCEIGHRDILKNFLDNKNVK